MRAFKEKKTETADFIFYYNQGKEEYEQKNKKAIVSYKKAEQIRSDDADLLYNMSLAYLFLEQDKLKAAEYLRKSIDSNTAYKQIAINQRIRNEMGNDIFDAIIKNSKEGDRK